MAFRKKLYRSIEELQADLDEWMRHYNEARTHQGRWCFRKTPMQTLLDSRAHAREKQNIGAAAQRAAPDSFDLADTRHAKSMAVRSSADFYC